MTSFISIPSQSQIWSLNALSSKTLFDSFDNHASHTPKRKELKSNLENKSQTISIHSWKSKKVLWIIDLNDFLFQKEYATTISASNWDEKIKSLNLQDELLNEIYSSQIQRRNKLELSQISSPSNKNTKSLKSPSTPISPNRLENDKSNIFIQDVDSSYLPSTMKINYLNTPQNSTNLKNKIDQNEINDIITETGKIIENGQIPHKSTPLRGIEVEYKNQDLIGIKDNSQTLNSPKSIDIVCIGTTFGRILKFSTKTREYIGAIDLYSDQSFGFPNTLEESNKTIFGKPITISSPLNTYVLSSISGSYHTHGFDLRGQNSNNSREMQSYDDEIYISNKNDFSNESLVTPKNNNNKSIQQPLKEVFLYGGRRGSVATFHFFSNYTKEERNNEKSETYSDVHSLTKIRNYLLFVGMSSGSLFVINVTNWTILQRFDGVHSHDIEHLLVISLPSEIQSQNLFNENSIQELKTEPTLKKDSNIFVVSSGADESIKFWSLQASLSNISCFLSIDNLKVQQMLEVSNYQNNGTHSFSLWIACHDGQIRIWDLLDFREKIVLNAHSSSVTSLCKLENEIWSSSEDQTICVWDVNSRKLLKQFPTEDSYVRYLLPVAKASVYRLWSINNNGNNISTRIWDAQNTFEFINTATSSENKINTLENENKILKNLLSQYIDENDNLKNKKSILNNKLESLEETLIKFQEENENKEYQIIELERHLQEESKSKNALEEERNILLHEITSLKDDNQDLVYSTSKLIESVNVIEKQRHEIEKLRAKVENQDETLKESKEEISELLHNIAKLEIELKQSQKSNIELSEQLKETKEKKFTLEAGKSYLSLQLEKYEPLLKKIEKSINELLFNDNKEVNERPDIEFLNSYIDDYLNFVLKSKNLDKICLNYKKGLDDILCDIEEAKSILFGEESEYESVENEKSNSEEELFNQFSTAVETISEKVLKERQLSREKIESLRNELDELKYEYQITKNELVNATNNLEIQSTVSQGLDKLIKLANSLHPLSLGVDGSINLEEKIRYIYQIIERNNDKHRKLVAELSLLDNTISDMCDLLTRFAETTPNLDVNPFMFDNTESNIIKSIIRELKRSAQFLYNEGSSNIWGDTSRISQKEKQLNNSFKSEKSFQKSFNSSISSQKHGNTLVIKHNNPSPTSKSNPNKTIIKPNVDVSPAEPSIEYRQHLLRLKISENCLRITHLYRQLEVSQDLQRIGSEEAKKVINDKNKLSDKYNHAQYVISQTIEILQNMVQVFAEKSQTSIPSLAVNLQEDNQKRLFRQLEHMQKSVEKIIISLKEKHNNTKSKLQQLRIKQLSK